ncbi:GH92 family glycosyl hydrolase [Amycolatopsis jiangsuensis]|uniref:Putative alpha-1,2-mannosidase n=1 Tax=Amycolatopsis jiangsuensis TaxID=1181879 RepID=A0A840IMN4_9PSEU|nr:GH92 family glycosyl hydrolase [Amycolatopsis jiangsuensis]MBB4683143.1 putative alpha-1,2-mannosidase [Amycolatopsis jiangsuensis]
MAVLPRRLIPFAAVAVIAAAAVVATPAAAAPGSFRTSFEAADPAPDWENTPEPGAHGVLPGATLPGELTPAVLGGTGTEPAGHGPETAADHDPATSWQVPAAGGSLTAGLAAAKRVTTYALTSATDSPARDPRTWSLQGSADGTHWRTVDERRDQDLTQRGQTRLFAVAHPGEYRHYRLTVRANHGDAALQLAEFALGTGSDDRPGLTAEVGDGPASGPTVKPHLGFNGTHSLHYEGWQTGARGAATDRLYDVSVPVRRGTRLSYVVFPEFTGNDTAYPSTYLALDLLFTDGSKLSDLPVTDQNGVRLTAGEQGAAKILHTGQWNQVTADLGAAAAGKTVRRVLLSWTGPGAPAHFSGWVDDIAIADGPAGTCAAPHPTECAVTTRGTNSSGDYSRGATIPATALPHGFNFWTPVTDASSTDTLYEYLRDNTPAGRPALQAFSTSHEPSPWVGDHQTFQVMPSTSDTPESADRAKRAMTFGHDHESARPDRYAVTFDNGLRTEMTPTEHAAVFRFRFPEGGSSLIFDNVDGRSDVTVDRETGVVTGYSDVSGFWGAPRMFVYATFDRPVTGSGELTGGGGPAAYAGFQLGAGRTLTMRIATSFLSVDQAKHNLDLEVGGRGFDQVRAEAQRVWDEQLGVITVDGATEDQLTSLYSSLYRLNLYPNELAENTGSAQRPDYRYASPYSPNAGENTPTTTGSAVKSGRPYANEGFWDTYRSAWSLNSLLYPALTGQMIDGFVQQYRDGGWLGQWTAPGYLGFSGTSSDAAIADAYLRGVTNFDVASAYEAAVKNAMVPSSGLTGRPDVQHTTFLGYTPSETGSGTSASLEDWIADYGIAQMSLKLYRTAKPDDPRRGEYLTNYHYFLDRSSGYEKLFEPKTGFFQPKTATGAWAHAPGTYDPLEWNSSDYTEGNGWTYAFSVPQDGNGLASLHGGRAGLARKLDRFFATPETAQYGGGFGGPYHEMFEGRDDRFGQWAFNDQPAMHVPYLYDYVGQPGKTAGLVRSMLARSFTGSGIGQGYPGDEDNGSMSAFYVMNALGFYPLQVGSPTFAVGSPLFDRATLHLSHGRTLTITAHGNSARNVYVQGMRVNGRPTGHTWVNHDDLAGGGRIDFLMGPRPSAWGTGAHDAPPSVSGPAGPDPQQDFAGPDTTTAAAVADNTSATVADLPASGSVSYHFPAAHHVEQYTLTSGTDAAADPSSWTLLGSGDGRHWTVLDRRQAQSFAWRNETRVYTPAKSGTYRYYRLDLAAASGAAKTSVAEVELLGHR